MKTIVKKLIRNIHIVVFLPGYIAFIFTCAISEKEKQSTAVNQDMKYSFSQLIEKIKHYGKSSY